MTRRQQLITQLRMALGSLESPRHHDSVIFDIAETDFEFTSEDLEREASNDTNCRANHP